MSHRKLHFKDEKDAVAEIQKLRSGHSTHGHWTFDQACWHCAFPVKKSLYQPKSTEPTADQKRAQTFLHDVAKHGWPKTRMDTPLEMAPPKKVEADAVDDLIATIGKLESYSHPHVEAFIFGPVETATFKKFALNHLAHHLEFFTPTSK